MNQLLQDSGSRLPFYRSSTVWTVSVLGIASLYVVLSYLLLPQSSPFAASTYTLTLLGKYFCFAILALALDLLWGYVGALSLGHGLFFACGAYGMGMYLARQIGDRGTYGNAELPDFMVFMDWQALPWYWLGFDWFAFAMLMALFVPALIAFIFGYFIFKSRVTGVYFSIITQAMTYAFMLAFYRNDMGFGGNNGLTDFKDILGFSLQNDNTRAALFSVTALMLITCFLFARWLMNSKTGSVCTAIRESESRVRFLGYRPERYKVFILVVSAVMAAIAGALYTPQVGIVNPGLFDPIFSLELVVWVAIGGRGTLYGAIIGAILVNYAKTYFTGAFPEVWLYALGALFIVSTIFFRQGVAGLFSGLLKKKAPQDSDDTPAEQIPTEQEAQA